MRPLRGESDELGRSAARSFEAITESDLIQLGDIAKTDRERMFRTNDRWHRYEGRLIAVALCQGAAQHFVDAKTGVKDFDVWTFFARSPSRRYPDPALYRRHASADFGPSRFGREPNAAARLTGRRVDLLARSLDVSVPADPTDAVATWLTNNRARSARLLAAKAVVLIEPTLGCVIWSPQPV